MVKLGPDLYTGADAYSGFQPTGNFTGFTMLHESGTGGAPKYGVVSQMPVVGYLANPLSDDVNDTRAAPDRSEVGYYVAALGSGTTLELAASQKAGLYQYTFPRGGHGGERFHVVVDVSHVLSSYRGQGLEQHFLGGNITVHQNRSSGHLRYTGFGTYDNVSLPSRHATRKATCSRHRAGLGMEQSGALDRLLLRPVRRPRLLPNFPRRGQAFGPARRVLDHAELRVALGPARGRLHLQPDPSGVSRRRLLHLARPGLRQRRWRDSRGDGARDGPAADARRLEFASLCQGDDERHQPGQAHPAVHGPVFHAPASHQQDGGEPALAVSGAVL